MGSENPDDHQRVAAAEEQKKRKRAESNRKYYQKIKKGKTPKSKLAQLKTVQNKCRGLKKRQESYEKSVMKPSLDDARKFRKSVLELGESSGHARDAVGKQTHLLDSLWELLKTPLPSGGTCGGTSASTDKDACPPLELSVAAMKPDGSVTTESFKPCQLLPEQWTPLECRGSTSYSTEVLEGVPNPMESAMSLNGSVMSGSFKPCESLPDADKLAFINKLKELYIASVAQHAQEKIRHAQEMAAIEARHTAAKDRHAQEMAAAKDRHDQEMAPANDRHDQEMAAAKERHDQEMAATKDRHAQEMAAAKERHDQEMAAVKTEYLGNLDLTFDGIDFDQLGFDGDTHM